MEMVPRDSSSEGNEIVLGRGDSTVTSSLHTVWNGGYTPTLPSAIIDGMGDVIHGLPTRVMVVVLTGVICRRLRINASTSSNAAKKSSFWTFPDNSINALSGE